MYSRLLRKYAPLIGMHVTLGLFLGFVATIPVRALDASTTAMGATIMSVLYTGALVLYMSVLVKFLVKEAVAEAEVLLLTADLERCISEKGRMTLKFFWKYDHLSDDVREVFDTIIQDADKDKDVFEILEAAENLLSVGSR